MSRQPQGNLRDSEDRPGQLRIRRLPDALVDQIAAGEVVERPASVVKELVENAVDAGASRLRIEVRGGGVDLVAVADDGSGMTPREARLALERHATSKLTCAEDLERISSFGFRGEALPAIASVSRLRLRTRRRGTDRGSELRVHAGRVLESREVGAAEGTRVEVADLFAGVPARRKFLKTPATEWGHIADWVGRAALALPHLHVDLYLEGREVFHWPATASARDRVAALLSEREAAGLLEAERQQGDLRLHALVSRPDVHRPTGSGIYLFVNGRPVRDRLLRHALLQVMRDVLPRGRFPTALLFLEVSPGAVDVNVHPAKWEVRFRDPRSVHHLVTAAVRDALEARSWLGGGGAPGPGYRPWPAAVADAQATRAAPGGDWTFASPSRAGEGAGPALLLPPPSAQRPLRFTELRLLGQLLGTYLLAEEKEGLLLVDQHAAHERILYEGLRAAWLEGGPERQALLAPASLELEPAQAAALAEHRDVARALGFEVEPFGAGAVVVRAVPALLAERDPLGLLRSLAEELRAAGLLGAPLQPGTRILEAADRLFASLACHAARRAGEVLSGEEQRALLDALDAIPWAPTCPHGRPVAVPVTRAEI